MRALGVIFALFGLAFLGSPDGREYLSNLSASSEAEEFESEESDNVNVREEMNAREPAWAKRCAREAGVYCPWAHSLGDKKTCLKLNFSDLPFDCQDSLRSE